MSSLTATSIMVASKICPKAPPGAQAPVDEITGYVLWGVIILFGLGVTLGIAAVAGGRTFGMPHASKMGVISIVIIFVSVIGYLVLPGMVHGMVGSGCI